MTVEKKQNFAWRSQASVGPGLYRWKVRHITRRRPQGSLKVINSGRQCKRTNTGLTWSQLLPQVKYQAIQQKRHPCIYRDIYRNIYPSLLQTCYEPTTVHPFVLCWTFQVVLFHSWQIPAVTTVSKDDSYVWTCRNFKEQENSISVWWNGAAIKKHWVWIFHSV